jgi:hypothetical protein
MLIAALLAFNVQMLPAFASYTTGSAQFGGSGQYLSVAASSDFAVGTGDFTVEWWQYMTEAPGDSLASRWPRVWWVDNNFGVSIEGAPDPIFYFWLGGARNVATLTNFSSNYKNRWVHFATTRTSSILRVFANGTQIGSDLNIGTDVTNSTTDLGLGSYPPDTACCQFPGRITNFHFVKGTSLYTSNFTVSSVPTTAVANTKLLLLNSNSGGLLSDSSPIGRAVTNVGSVTFSATSPDWTNPDTTPPSVSTTAFNAAENQTAIGTLAANESVTWSKVGGVDSASVSVVSGTGVITFNSAPNFEAPSDVGADNIYNVTIRATDTAGNITNQAITITVTDVVDTSSFNSLVLSGSASYRQVVTITANVSVASRVTFRAKNIIISGCKNKLTSGSSPNIIATCTWKPAMRGAVVITATATPTNGAISGATANPVKVIVSNRVGAR